MRTRHCFVPSCENNSDNCGKVFVTVPTNLKRRLIWWQSVGHIEPLHAKAHLYCCEDHFNIPEDFVNWDQAKQPHIKLRIKPNVLPITYPGEGRNPVKIEEASSCSLADAPPVQLLSTHENDARKRGHEDLIERQTKFVKLEEPCCSTKTNSPPGNVELLTPSITFKVPEVPISPHKSQSIESNSTSLTSSDADLSSSLSLASESTTTEDTPRLKHIDCTMDAIKRDTGFFLGLPKETFHLVKIMCREINISYRDALMVLNKVRLNDPFQRMAVYFDLSLSQVHQIIHVNLPKVADFLNDFIRWPKSADVRRALPIPFRARYAKVQSIIDCFEVEIEKPSDPVMQASTWSTYKGHNTVKFLISCTPNGYINFISLPYPGRITDNAIIQASGFCSNVPEGAMVLADRGFKNIEEMLLQRNCTLIRPPSVKQNHQSSSKDVKLSKRVASLIKHVERIIQRVREFNMLNGCVHHSMIPLLADAAVIACAVINFQRPIL